MFLAYWVENTLQSVRSRRLPPYNSTMMRLTREVRFALTDSGAPVLNAWAGWPVSNGIAPFLTLRIAVEGSIDPGSGYLCNIRDLDQLARQRAILLFSALSPNRAGADPRAALGEVWTQLARDMPDRVQMAQLELALSPFVRLTISKESPDMLNFTEAFEFSASHRLYSPACTEEENRRLFGKCANLNGHGHNYVVEVTVAGPLVASAGSILPHAQLETIVKSRVIDRFDHRHLNLDCPEFANLNPTVENITAVIWQLLHDQLHPARLHCVRVWETPKTFAEYRE